MTFWSELNIFEQPVLYFSDQHKAQWLLSTQYFQIHIFKVMQAATSLSKLLAAKFIPVSSAVPFDI